MKHSLKVSQSLQRWGLLLLLFVFSLAGLPWMITAQAQAQPAAPCSRREEFKSTPGLGPACKRSDGMWAVMFADGTIALTHGPDPAPAQSQISAAPSALAAPSPVTCAPANTYRARVLYARPTDRADQYAARLGTIRSYIQGMQDALNNESMLFGISSSYRVACDADGQVTVQNVALSLNSTQNNISAITNDLKAKGFNSTFDKYIIIYEQPSCGGGVAWAETNDALDVNNNANHGPSYGISWGFCGFATVMHENGHNMGAVMNSAPNTTGAGHCIDDQDIMCYNDGGPRGSQLHIVCTDFEHFDCNHDDYFSPNPPAGSYLATHWNIGNCMNRFVQRSGCGGGAVGVTFYQDANYGGALSGVKGLGDYASLPADVPNDWMSSLRVPAGWAVDIYANGSFGGTVCTFTADTTFVGTACNDIMSSFRIRTTTGATPTRTPTRTNTPVGPTPTRTRTPTPVAAGVIFYQDINFAGAASGLKAKGDYAVMPGDVPNDWMSSLRVPAGWIVDAYADGNFTGAVCTYTADTSWVGTACNDVMSSFRIR